MTSRAFLATVALIGGFFATVAPLSAYRGDRSRIPFRCPRDPVRAYAHLSSAAARI
jgi:hypothetical protein